jgi:hypothetical protein
LCIDKGISNEVRFLEAGIIATHNSKMGTAMNVLTPTPNVSRSAACSDAEWEARCELAAIYNWRVKYRLTDQTNQWHALPLSGEDALLTHHCG